MVVAENKNSSKLVLGTAQFGLNYGISNKRGQIPHEEVCAILDEATRAGITTLDTAAAYGGSEQSIGAALQDETDRFNIISKYPPNTPDKSIGQALEESLKRLRVNKLYGYMLHSYSSYSNSPAILQELQELKAAGKVEKIGISLYHPQEAEELLLAGTALDMVQVPYSVFDRRFDAVLQALQQAGIQTHVRSVYLQGLYFMPLSALPDYFKPVAPKLERLQQLSTTHNLPLGSLLLGFALANQFISHVVIGVESLQTLQENITWASTELSEILLAELQNFSENNEDIILPYKWPAS